LQKKSLLNSDEVENEVKELQQRHIEMKEEFETKTEELKISNTLHELLKDTGIKADIIKQYIPMLCAYVNSYLSKLNISLTFDMDENFNEVISTIYADNFTYNNLSAGERTRLDLALAFSWMQVAKAKGSVDTNLLILDEVLDANLDESGTLAAFDIVNDISKNGSNVFIVSHKANLEEYVTSVLSLNKTDGFTQIL
jgi:DNA repair exonuclease SbcCD ATPase subunit